MLDNDNITCVNGMSYSIKYDLVQPCNYCGVPCLGTYLFWYVYQDQHITLETDQGSLDLLCDEIIAQTSKSDNYSPLPDFIREMYYCHGWQDKTDGGILDIDDFLLAIDIMEQFKDTSFDPEHTRSLLTSQIGRAHV